MQMQMTGNQRAPSRDRSGRRNMEMPTSATPARSLTVKPIPSKSSRSTNMNIRTASMMRVLPTAAKESRKNSVVFPVGFVSVAVSVTDSMLRCLVSADQQHRDKSDRGVRLGALDLHIVCDRVHIRVQALKWQHRRGAGSRVWWLLDG
ncbi:hypothetical protein ACFPRL_23465 [Pseudoclavibacter helvolus]